MTNWSDKDIIDDETAEAFAEESMRAAEPAPIDEIPLEDRTLPTVPPAALLEGLSQLWAYPYGGVNAINGILTSMIATAELATWRDDFTKLVQDLDEYAAASESVVGADACQLDYARLFIGSFKMYAPPYASYYLDGEGQMYGPTAVEIEDVYAQFKLEIDPEAHDMPDHLRFLLAFLGLLAANYTSRGDDVFAFAYEDFRDAYVTSWIGQLRANIHEYSEFVLYRDLVDLTIRVL